MIAPVLMIHRGPWASRSLPTRTPASAETMSPTVSAPVTAV